MAGSDAGAASGRGAASAGRGASGVAVRAGRETVAESAQDATAAAFLGSARDAFDAAARRCDVVTRRFRVGGRRLELRFAGPALVARVVPAIEHLATPEPGVPDLTVSLFDTRSTGAAMPSPPWTGDDHRERGEIRGFNTARFRTAYNLGSDTLSVLDRTRGEAVFWTPDADAVPYYETASPLRTLLAWWLESAGLQTVHAAGVGLGEDGLLLTARGGSGKSTTALLCLEDGFGYAGDNNVLVDGGGPPWCHSLYNSASLRPDNLHRLPGLRSLIRNEDRLATEKALLFLHERAPGRMLLRFRVRAVLLPQVVGEVATRVVPARPGECLRALAPSTLFSLPGARDEAFGRTAALARTVPAYHLRLGSDLAAIPGVLRDLLAEHAS